MDASHILNMQKRREDTDLAKAKYRVSESSASKERALAEQMDVELTAARHENEDRIIQRLLGGANMEGVPLAEILKHKLDMQKRREETDQKTLTAILTSLETLSLLALNQLKTQEVRTNRRREETAFVDKLISNVLVPVNQPINAEMEGLSRVELQKHKDEMEKLCEKTDEENEKANQVLEEVGKLLSLGMKKNQEDRTNRRLKDSATRP